jgi:hypothetical protein
MERPLKITVHGAGEVAIVTTLEALLAERSEAARTA